MMQKTRAISVVALLLIIAGCKPATQVPSLDRIYKVDEFDRDAPLRRRTLAACSANPGQLKDDPNCINVMASRMGAGGQQDRKDEVRVIAARQDLAVILIGLTLYRLDSGMYPTQAQGLRALVEKPTAGPISPNWKGYLERLPADPWGNAYSYLNPGVHGEIEVLSYGADGQPGGDSVAADISTAQPEVQAAKNAYIKSEARHAQSDSSRD